ncbi:hypothetical protein LWI29_033440 [Acer saccharum]|uniref:Uncharacterized protein n=1 Tax=Acer saccharum TaxID=4024 RepID=A0AA39SSC0_ACESA|nr:hypothetical protein LWI29_033440 [Acer saccharum]
MGGGGGELRYEISQNAYIKLVLYARKHKTAAVNGVLVGRVSPQKNDIVEITDSVPRLSPVMKEEEHTTNNIIAGAKDSTPEVPEPQLDTFVACKSSNRFVSLRLVDSSRFSVLGSRWKVRVECACWTRTVLGSSWLLQGGENNENLKLVMVELD